MTKKADLEIEITLDDGTIKKGFANITKQAKKTSKATKKTFQEDIEGGLSSSLAGLKGKIAGIGIALVAAFGAREAITAANRQENAINKLNASLRGLGFSSDAIKVVSKDLQSYAGELQNVTRFGDEAILEQLAFAQAMGATSKQSKTIVTAATDMAAALNIDLNSAVRNIAKTLGGFAGELGEVIPELKNLTKEQLQSGEAIDLLGKKYQGFANNDTQTFQGKTDQLSNSFGDLVEEIGFMVTRSSSAKAGIEGVTTAVQALIKAIQPDTLQEVNTEVSSLQVVYDRLIAQKNKIKSDGGLFESFKLNAINKEISFAGEGLDQLKGKAERLRLAQAADDSIDTDDPERVRLNLQAIEQVRQQVKTLGFSELQLLDMQQKEEEALLNLAHRDGIITDEQSFQERLTLVQENYSNKRKAIVDKEAASMRKNMINVGRVISSNLAKSVAGGMQLIVSNIMSGENAFANFGKFVLTAMGDMSIQLGQMFIAKGLAVEAFKGLAGGAAVAAGLSLIALGQVAKSYSGSVGGGGSSIATGSNLGPDSSYNDRNQEIITPVESEERAEVGTSVQVVVQGNIYNPDEAANNIADLLNNAFDQRGLTLRGA